MNSRILLTSLAALLGAVHSASANIAVDFGDYADNTAFLVDWSNNGGGTSSPGFSLAGGVVGLETGTWGGANYDTTMNFTGGSYDFAADSVTTVSTLFKFIADTGTGTPVIGQVGLSAASGETFRGEEGMSFVTGRVLRITSGTPNPGYRLDFQYKAASAGTTVTTQSGTLFAPTALTQNNWYLLTTTMTKGTGSDVNATVSLIDYGADGATPGSTISTMSATNQNIGAALYGDMEMYLGLRSLVDNDHFVFGEISAVPEPATFALLAGALALGLVMWRRRR